jgi:hypothetical protein
MCLFVLTYARITLIKPKHVAAQKLGVLQPVRWFIIP